MENILCEGKCFQISTHPSFKRGIRLISHNLIIFLRPAVQKSPCLVVFDDLDKLVPST